MIYSGRKGDDMKLIVVEGVDSSGKETNTKYIYDLLVSNGHNAKKISFPNYESNASALVKMYLGGEFGNNPNDVNAYAASAFYAVDRYASFKQDWGNFDGIVVADRYVSSNMIHQASKIEDIYEKNEFLKWLDDFEYNKLGLPRPDYILFLNMPVWAAMKLMEDRKNKITGEDKKDIHEKNQEYLEKSYNNALYVAKRLNWNIVNCTEGDRIKSLDEIQKEIKALIENKIF